MQRTLATIAIISTLILTGCATAAAPTAATSPTITETAIPQPTKPPITVAAYGDSITAWTVNNYVVPTWVNYLGPDVQFTTEGWAGGGAKLDRILANARPITADVLIIAAGTNDEGDVWGTPMGKRLSEVDALVIKSNPKRVVLDAVPPRDLNPTWSDGWNAELQKLAAARGWGYFDPWSFLRAPDGHYLPGTTHDGIHPTEAAQITAGGLIRAYLLGE